MSRVASIDGKLSALEDAVVPVLDRGFLYADGVFETLRVYAGEPFELEEHLARLARSAAAVRIALPVPVGTLERELREALDRASEPEATARIMITRGLAPEPSLLPHAGLRATRVILVEPLRVPPRETYVAGVRAITLAWGRGDDAWLARSAKLLSYVTSVVALDEARARGADDAIFVGADDRVREASFSNLFVVDPAGNLATPSEGPGVLGGITRGVVLDLACSLGLSCSVQSITKGALAVAREVFLTSSVREIVSVVAIDGAPVGAGVPGDVARMLHQALRLRAGAKSPPPWA
jgi:branched-chain amino acid aminotransferase